MDRDYLYGGKHVDRDYLYGGKHTYTVFREGSTWTEEREALKDRDCVFRGVSTWIETIFREGNT